MFIYPDASVKEIILAIEGDTTIFPAGMTLRIYTNDLTPTRNSVVGDFTQLTNVEVPGYVATTPTWDGTPIRTPLGEWEDYGSDSMFAATGSPPSPQICYGWYLTDAGNTALVAAGRFAVPFTFVATGDGFRLEPVMRVSQDSGNTVSVLTDMLVEG